MPDVEIRFMAGRPIITWAKNDAHITRIEVDNENGTETTVFKFRGCALIEEPYTLKLSPVEDKA